MLENLARIEDRFDELTAAMAQPEVATDYLKVTEYAQERADIAPLITLYREYKDVLSQIEDAHELLEEQDSEIVDLAKAELEDLEPRAESLLAQLKRMLLPKDPRDEKNVIVEVRAGAGGDEAGLFAADLSRMYMRYAENNRWKTEILSTNETGIGGYKEIVFQVIGKGAYSRLKFESGVHRVQRVPSTESGGRIHTSAATVAVLPEAEDVDIQIDPGDLRIDTMRSSGAGGQHVNTTDSAVRITHVPTGLVVTSSEKSQHRNREIAMQVLKARLYDLERSRVDSERSADRAAQVGSGDRSERIRTYNFPQGRMTDHRINLTLYRLDAILQGDLDEIVDALTADAQARQMVEMDQ